MKRTLTVLVGIIVLVRWGWPSLPTPRTPRIAYTVGQLRVGLKQDQKAWVNRTLRVRGIALVSDCGPGPYNCADSITATTALVSRCVPGGPRPRQVIADAVGSRNALPLTWQAEAPALAFLRRAPLLDRLAPSGQMLQWGTLTTYRVRVQMTPRTTIGPACYAVVVLDGVPDCTMASECPLRP
jgi:hypothetical protein